MSTWTIPQFAKSIRDKYPGKDGTPGPYDDWSDSDLTQAIVEKFPAYKNQIESPKQALGRALPATFGGPKPTQLGDALSFGAKSQIGTSMQNLGALKENNPAEYQKQQALAKETANIQPSVKYSATVGATKDVPYSLSRVADNLLEMMSRTPQSIVGRQLAGDNVNLAQSQHPEVFGGYRDDVRKYLSQPNVQRALNNPTFWQNIARTAPNVAAQLVEIAALTPIAGPGALFLQSYVQDYDLPVKDQIKAQLTNLAFMGAGKIGGKVAGATLKGSGMGARIARNLAVRTTQAGAGYATTKLSGGTDVQAQSAGALGFALPAGTKGLGEEPAAPPPAPRPIRGLLGEAPPDVAAAGRPDSVLITTQFPQQPYGSRTQNTEAGPITTQKGETGFGALGVRRVPTPIAEEFHSQLGTFIDSEAFGQLHPIEQAELLRLQTQVGEGVAKAKEAAPGTGLMKPGEAGEGTVAVPTNLQIGGKTVGVEHFKQVIRTHLDSGETALVGNPVQQPLTLASFEGHLESPTNEPLRAGQATERGTASGLPAGQIRVDYATGAEHLKALEAMTFAVGKKGPVTLPDGTPVLKKSFKTKSSYEQEMILNEINRLRVEIPKANQFQKPTPNTTKGTEDPNAPLPEPGGSFLTSPQGGPNAPRPQSPNVGTNQGVPPGPDLPGNEGQVRQSPSGSPSSGGGTEQGQQAASQGSPDEGPTVDTPYSKPHKIVREAYGEFRTIAQEAHAAAAARFSKKPFTGSQAPSPQATSVQEPIKENPNAPTSSPSTGGPPDLRTSVSSSSDPLQQRGSNVPETPAEVHQTVNPAVSSSQASGEASQPPRSSQPSGPTAPPEAFGGNEGEVTPPLRKITQPAQKGEIDPTLQAARTILRNAPMLTPDVLAMRLGVTTPIAKALMEQISKESGPSFKGQKGEIDPELLNAPWRIAKKVAEFVGGAKAAPKAETAEALPPPGAATPFNDMSRVETITSNFKTANKVLLEHPETASMMDGMQRAQDKKMAWIGTTLRTLSAANKGINSLTGLSGLQGAKLASDLAMTQEPADMQSMLGQISPKLGIPYTQAAIDSALGWAKFREEVHAQFPPKAGPAGRNVGYLSRYLTQMESLVGDTDLRRGINQIWDYSIKGGLRSTIDAFKQNPILKPKTGGAFDKFTTDPSSPYVKTRTGKIQDMELDIRRIEAAYVNSAAKVIFDRPMIQNAKLQAMDLPQSALRDFATATIKNVARYDAHPELDRAWTAMTSSVLKTYARSVLGFNPVVAGYHAYRLFTDVWPAIETKYLVQGAAEFGKNPLKAMQETARLGLIPSDVKPWSFKTIGEKGNAMLQLFSIGDYFSRSIGYQSFKAKYLAEGLSPEEATLKAITQTKNTTQLVDPIRTQRLLFGKGPEGGLIHLITQFKQQPTMIAEQYIDVLKHSTQDPAAFAKLGASLIGGIAIMQLSGFKALHLAPSIWTGVGGGLGEFLDSTRKFGAALIDMSKWHYAKDDYDRETYAQRAKQNIEQLVINLAKDVTPGGWSVTRQIAHGKPGFMEPTPKEPARETRPRRVEKSLKDMVFK